MVLVILLMRQEVTNMKIVILGEEKGMFKNLVKWINETGEHEAVLWGKFYPDGNKETAEPCPIAEPDIIMCLSNYVTYEDLPYMGITTKPKRVYYNLGNRSVSNILKDWRMAVFNDAYASYNPEHAQYQIPEEVDRFRDLQCLPLPFDSQGLEPKDYSQSELTTCQTLSNLAMMGAYSKQSMMVAKGAKEADVPFNLIFGLKGEEYYNEKGKHPVVFDNLKGMFGVTSLEAMALGQVVICSLTPTIAAKYEELLGAPLPIIQANNVEEIKTVLNQMKNGTIDWKAKCLESRQFMAERFTGSKIAQLYLNYFNSLLGE